MKLSARLLLPAVLGAALVSAFNDGSVFIFQGDEWPNSLNPPTLSPEEARLVFAQRLGVSQYHGIGDASESTLAHINTFGGGQDSIFQDSRQDKAAELVLLVQGVSSRTAKPLIDAWSSYKPAFKISNAPSANANQRFIEDLQQQLGQTKSCPLEDAINPFNDKCWDGKANALFMGVNVRNQDIAVTDLMAAQERLIRFARNNEMNVIVIFMPDSNSSPKTENAYGSYEMPSQVTIGRRQVVEEPMSSSAAFKTKQVMTANTSQPAEPITGVLPVCHSSLDGCMSLTNNCSGHGECYMKYGPAEGEDASPACYTCGCVPTKEEVFLGGDKTPVVKITYWGGPACQKKDVSGPFWLFAIFTVVMIGLVSWAIGLLFSIGEEKLPGVIGAGVSSKTR